MGCTSAKLVALDHFSRNKKRNPPPRELWRLRPYTQLSKLPSFFYCLIHITLLVLCSFRKTKTTATHAPRCLKPFFYLLFRLLFFLPHFSPLPLLVLHHFLTNNNKDDNYIGFLPCHDFCCTPLRSHDLSLWVCEMVENLHPRSVFRYQPFCGSFCSSTSLIPLHFNQ